MNSTGLERVLEVRGDFVFVGAMIEEEEGDLPDFANADFEDGEVDNDEDDEDDGNGPTDDRADLVCLGLAISESEPFFALDLEVVLGMGLTKEFLAAPAVLEVSVDGGERGTVRYGGSIGIVMAGVFFFVVGGVWPEGWEGGAESPSGEDGTEGSAGGGDEGSASLS